VSVTLGISGTVEMVPATPLAFRVLGRVEAGYWGRRIEISRRRERCLLAVLLLACGSVVSVERLIDLLWDEPPRTARSSLHTHVTRLRAALQSSPVDLSINRANGGYRLEVDSDEVDAHRFVTLVRRARGTDCLESRAAVLDQALALWRGPMIAADASPRLRARICAEMTELRSLATRMWLVTGLALGRHEEMIADLLNLTSEQPYNERLVAGLMIALYRSGRQAEALLAFDRIRAALRTELGVEPGSELGDVRTGILRGEPM
jgi:DNA-binding SARP family transcriptional activator